MRVLCLLCLVVVAGCPACPNMNGRDGGVDSGFGGGVGAGGGQGGGQGGGTADAGGQALTGHHVIFSRVGSTDLPAPDVNPAANIAVLVPQSNGTFSNATVTNTGDGGFRVDGLPPGEVYVRMVGTGPTQYVVTTSRTLNLEDYRLGRPGPDATDTTVTLTLSNLESTDAPDFQLVSPNTGTAAAFFPDSAPTMAITSVTDEPGQLSYAAGGFPDGTAQDITWLLQQKPFDVTALEPLFDGGLLTSASAVRALWLNGLSLSADGGTLSGAFETGATPQQLEVTVAADWALHGAEMSDAGFTGFFFVSAYPAPNAPGLRELWVGYSGFLVDFSSDPLPLEFTLRAPFINPYPAEWKTVLNVASVVAQRSRLPGTTSGSITATLSDSKPLSSPVRFSPRMLPARAFTIGGVDAHENGGLANLTPLLAWQAPPGTSPTAYSLAVFRLWADGTRTRSEKLASFLTRGTSLRIPPGTMSSGVYVFRLTALLTPQSLIEEPFLQYGAIDLASADVLSGMWRSP